MCVAYATPYRSYNRDLGFILDPNILYEAQWNKKNMEDWTFSEYVHHPEEMSNSKTPIHEELSRGIVSKYNYVMMSTNISKIPIGEKLQHRTT